MQGMYSQGRYRNVESGELVSVFFSQSKCVWMFEFIRQNGITLGESHTLTVEQWGQLEPYKED